MLIHSLLVVVFYSGLVATLESQERPVRVLLKKSTINPNDGTVQSKDVYYAHVSLGRPAQSFKLLVDTSTYDSWLPQYTWNPFASNLHYKDGYKLSDSGSDLNQGLTINYRNTKLTGELTMDRLRFDAGLATNWTFLRVSSASNKQFGEAQFDGVLGLALSKPSYFDYEAGAFDMFYGIEKSQRPKELIFSLFYSQDGQMGGELHFGGIVPSLLAEGEIIHYHPLAMVNKWLVEASEINLGTEYSVECNLHPENCYLLFDSGMSDAWGPENEVDAIYKNLGAEFDEDSGLHIVHCDKADTLPSFKFTMKRTLEGPSSPPLEFEAKNYIKKLKPASELYLYNRCYVAIHPNPGQAMPKKGWVLGTNFMSAYYTVFDIMGKKVGLGKARQSSMMDD